MNVEALEKDISASETGRKDDDLEIPRVEAISINNEPLTVESSHPSKPIPPVIEYGKLVASGSNTRYLGKYVEPVPISKPPY